MKARILSLFILLSIIVFSTPANAMPDLGQAIDNFFYHLTSVISSTGNAVTGYSTMSCSLRSCTQKCPVYCAMCTCPGNCAEPITQSGSICGELKCPSNYPYYSCPSSCQNGCEKKEIDGLTCYKCKSKPPDESKKQCPPDYPHRSYTECPNGYSGKKYVAGVGYCFKCKQGDGSGTTHTQVGEGGCKSDIAQYSASKCHSAGNCYWTGLVGGCQSCHKGVECSFYPDESECKLDPCHVTNCDWVVIREEKHWWIPWGKKIYGCRKVTRLGGPSCKKEGNLCRDKSGNHYDSCVSSNKLKQWSCKNGWCVADFKSCRNGCKEQGDTVVCRNPWWCFWC